ncbi:MAG: hypothetical protein L0211_21120, partial [Planctomycetaceae bacterium]|nr:hypothetical protein [Planctomycetaceae bacterium]
MTTREPNLLTLLDWSHRRAAGQPCAEWEAWRASSPKAAREAEELMRVEKLLATGDAPLGATELGAADVAQLIEGQLSPEAAAQIEEICFRSPAELSEVASSVQFCRQLQELPEVSSDLTRRLVAIGPRAAERRTRRAMANGAGFQPARSAVAKPTSPSRVTPAIAVHPRRRVTSRVDHLLRRYWPLAAAAVALVAAAIGGVIGLSMLPSDGTNRVPVPVVRDHGDKPAQDHLPEQPTVNRIVIKPAPLDPERSPAVNAAPQSPLPPVAPNEQPATVVRQHPIPAPAGPPRLEASIHSAIGAVLVDPGH